MSVIRLVSRPPALRDWGAGSSLNRIALARLDILWSAVIDAPRTGYRVSGSSPFLPPSPSPSLSLSIPAAIAVVMGSSGRVIWARSVYPSLVDSRSRQ